MFPIRLTCHLFPFLDTPRNFELRGNLLLPYQFFLNVFHIKIFESSGTSYKALTISLSCSLWGSCRFLSSPLFFLLISLPSWCVTSWLNWPKLRSCSFFDVWLVKFVAILYGDGKRTYLSTDSESARFFRPSILLYPWNILMIPGNVGVQLTMPLYFNLNMLGTGRSLIGLELYSL